MISTLLSSGGEFADLFCQDMTARMVEAESGQIERISTTREKGICLRLIRQGVTHFATTVDLAPNTLLHLASGLASGAGSLDRAGKVNLTELPPGPLPMGEDPAGIHLEEKGKLVMGALNTLDGFDSRLVQVKSIWIGITTIPQWPIIKIQHR